MHTERLTLIPSTLFGLEPQNGGPADLLHVEALSCSFSTLLQTRRSSLALQQFKGSLQPAMGHNVAFKKRKQDWIRD